MSTRTIQNPARIPASIRLVCLVILVVSLAGCAPAPAQPPLMMLETRVIPTETPTPTVAPTGTSIQAPTATAFIPKATINIFVHGPLSGDQSLYGISMLHGAEIAVQHFALPLAELGYKVELISYDDQSNPAIAEKNAWEIGANPNILCGLGHYDSKVTILASEIYHQKGLAFISLADSVTAVTDRNYLEINRVVGRDDSQGMAAAQFALAQGFKSAYALGTTTPSSQKNIDYFKREADRIGLRTVGVFLTEVTDSEGAMRRMLEANPDLVYFAGRVSQANRFFKKARTEGYTGAFLGTGAINDPALVRRADLSLIGGGLYFTDIVAPAASYPDATNFILSYRAAYDSFPELYAAQAYDAAGVCMQAIAEGSKAKSGQIPTRLEVATAIRALKNFEGITGTFNFNERGDPTLAKYFVYQIVSVHSYEWDKNTIIATYEVEPP